MIDVSVKPKNAEHLARLLAFARDVLDVCDREGVTPVLDGSLAVFAYTSDPSLEVRDIDFSCPESHFPRLQLGLESRGIACTVQPWHVLQARRADLKVEFGATEHWNEGIPEEYVTARIGEIEFRMLGLDALRETYQRGLAATAHPADAQSRRKHQSIGEKLRLLDALNA